MLILQKTVLQTIFNMHKPEKIVMQENMQQKLNLKVIFFSFLFFVKKRQYMIYDTVQLQGFMIVTVVKVS